MLDYDTWEPIKIIMGCIMLVMGVIIMLVSAPDIRMMAIGLISLIQGLGVITL